MSEPTFAEALAAILNRDGLALGVAYAAADAAAVLPRWRALPPPEAARHAAAADFLATIPGAVAALPRRPGAPWPGGGVPVGPVEHALRVEAGQDSGPRLAADLLYLLAEAAAADLARAAAAGLALDFDHAAALLEAAAAGERIRGEIARRRTGG